MYTPKYFSDALGSQKIDAGSLKTTCRSRDGMVVDINVVVDGAPEDDAGFISQDF